MIRWAMPSAIIVALQALLCVIASQYFDIGAKPPIAQYLSAGLSVLMGGSGLWIAWKAFPLRHHKRALYDLWGEIRGRSSTLMSLTIAMLLIAGQFVILTWSKTALAATMALWADPMLADLDSNVLGQDAWRIAHFIRMPWMDTFYHLWLPTIFFGLSCLVVKQDDRAIVAFFATSFLGLAVMFVWPSGGPIFYERLGYGPRFADIPNHLLTRAGADYLWEAYLGQGSTIGIGISAMPSMHVALAFWLAISLRKWWAILWAMLIFWGSVYLGWHYVSDGLVGAILAIIGHSLARRLGIWESRRHAVSVIPIRSASSRPLG